MCRSVKSPGNVLGKVFETQTSPYLGVTLEHMGHTSLDLNWPWKRSTIKESFLILCLCHASSATTCISTQQEGSEKHSKLLPIPEARQRGL